MMRYYIIGLIHLITVASKGEPPKIYDSTILKASESRYHPNADYPDGDFRNYNNRITQKDYLPIPFKPPHYEANDYWRNQQGYDNRRTFYDDYTHKTTTFPRFYQYVTSIFSGRDENTPEHHPGYHYSRNHPTPPYPFDLSFNYRPTEPNYIPPPKPIRASVIKLETITRSPIYPHFEYETTPKYYPHPGSLLNHVLIENSKSDEPNIPSFKPLTVLPKPAHVPPTTLKPNHPFFNHTNTDYKYPDSVQDQLPNFNQGEVRIPYVSEKPIPQIFNTVTTKIPSPYHSDVFPPSNSRATTNIIDLIDIRSINPVETTTVKSFPGAVEKVNRPIYKYTKKLTAQLDKNSIERVANLTVQGFSKPHEKDKINNINQPPKVKDLINYDIRRFENISNQTTNNSTKRLVNLNDELSLDAKILKDTNWDGFTIFPTTPTYETTTFRTIKTTVIKPSRNKTAFWEIVEPQTTTEITTTTEQTITTTTESTSISTTETNENESTTTEEIRLENTTQPITESSESDSTTPPPSPSPTTTTTRRYSRRPKVANFTPYPTPEEIQKKLINRNHFSKRQKPNITLAFGNKNVLKSRNNLGKDEVMKFSDEEVRRRRKIGKRRQVLKRVRLITSERPFQNQ